MRNDEVRTMNDESRELPALRRSFSSFIVHHSSFSALLLALLLTLPALLPLLRAGFFVSDDGLFHVYRTAALAEAWQHGVLWPRLFPDFGFGYGQAVLNFYAPLSYVPGALLSMLGVNPATAVQLVIALSFLLAAAAAFGYGNFLFGPAGGVLAAVVYTYTPYHLADAYLRGAVPEHMAFIFPPLILWAFTAAFWPTYAHRSRDASADLSMTQGDASADLSMTQGDASADLSMTQGDASADLSMTQGDASAGMWTRSGEDIRALNALITDHRSPFTPLLWGSLAWAGLVLTHNLTALLMIPVALLQLGVLAVWTRRWRRLWGAAGALALAAGLSAVFWLPALVESRAVGLSVGASEGYANHMLTAATTLRRSLAFFLNPPETLGPVFPLSWFALALTAAGTILLLRKLPSFRKDGNFARATPLPMLGFHLAVAISAMFMTTAASLFIWQPLTAILGQLQYPWRFLLLEAVGLMGVAAALPALLPRGSHVDRVPSGWFPIGVFAVSRSAWVVAAVSLLAMLAALPGLRVEPLPVSVADARLPARMWAEDAAAGQVGATWTGEFLPLTVAEQRWALGRAREGAVDGPALQPAPAVTLARRGYASWTAQVETAAPLPLRLHQFHQPGWNATVDGQPAATYPTGELGLVTVDVPAGTHQVVLSFGATPARTAGLLLSLAAAAIWIVLAFVRTRSRMLRATGVALGVFAVALALNSLGVGQRAWTPQPVRATLEDVAVLLAADATPLDARAGLPTEPALAEVTLYWLALRETAQNYKAFVHLLGPDGSVIAQHDGDPVGGFTPTSRWRPGQIIADRHILTLPEGLPAGDYGLRAGLYQVDPLRNLAVDPPAADNRVDIGKVTLPQ